MYDAVFFDLDGTILNTLGDLTGAAVFCCDKYGLNSVDSGVVRSYLGDGIRMLVRRLIGRDVDDGKYTEILGSFTDYYSEHLSCFTFPYDGVVETLKLLKSKGIKLFVLSNKNHELACRLVNEFFVGIFDDCFGVSKELGFMKKPCGDSLRFLVTKHGLNLSSCLFVGDSDVDFLTASDVGMDCCLVRYGFKDRDLLDGLAADHFCDSFVDLVNIICE